LQQQQSVQYNTRMNQLSLYLCDYMSCYWSSSINPMEAMGAHLFPLGGPSSSPYIPSTKLLVDALSHGFRREALI
jgi:hypothetical protein